MNGRTPTRERGRLARPIPGAARHYSPVSIDPKCLISSPSAHPASQESHRRAPPAAHRVAGNWFNVRQLCGRDARAPGWASSHEVVISRSRYRRCIRPRLVIEGGPSLFVFINRPVSPRLRKTAIGRRLPLPGCPSPPSSCAPPDRRFCSAPEPAPRSPPL